jgi:peptidyl-prolyl cis-trans isomerase C
MIFRRIWLTLAILMAVAFTFILPGQALAQKKAGVLATVDGTDISVEDFNKEMLRVQLAVLNSGKVLSCPQVTKLRTEVAEGLVRRELLFQEAKKKVKVTEAEVNDEMKKLKDQYGSDANFTAALSASNVTPATLKAQIERTLLIQKYIETQFSSKVTVTDQEIRAAYDRNRDSFRQPEQVKASHILVKVDAQADAKKKAEARKKIDDVKARVAQKQDFESLARTYSEDPSGSKGGDIGYVARGQVLKPFEDVLFALKTGEVSDVVETPLGYHLIKATDRKAETVIPFETLKDQLAKALKQEKGQQEATASIGKVREATKVTITLPPEE